MNRDGPSLPMLEDESTPQLFSFAKKAVVDSRLVHATASAWEQQLAEWEITSSEQRRLVTEAALWNSLFTHGLYQDSILISDDAKQFKIVGFLHALSWVHQERHIARLIPLTTRQRQAHSRIRDAIWQYYQRLKAYRAAPTKRRRAGLERDFDALFNQKTG